MPSPIPADDIFAATPTDVKEKEAAAAAATTAGPAVAPGAGARKGLLDNYDDAEGYYNFQVWGRLLLKHKHARGRPGIRELHLDLRICQPSEKAVDYGQP